LLGSPNPANLEPILRKHAFLEQRIFTHPFEAKMTFFRIAAAVAIAVAPVAAKAVTHSYVPLFGGMTLSATNAGAPTSSDPNDIYAPGEGASMFQGAMFAGADVIAPAGEFFYVIFDFQNMSSVGSALELLSTTTNNPAGSFVDLQVGWVGASGRDMVDDGTLSVLDVATAGGVISTGAGDGVLSGAEASGGAVEIYARLVAGETLSLVATWTGASAGDAANLRVAGSALATPLPPGALLIGTALLGAGAVSRRRRKSGV
jgi:hypothetical protein